VANAIILALRESDWPAGFVIDSEGADGVGAAIGVVAAEE